MAFSKIDPKMSMWRSPTDMFFVLKMFYRKLVKFFISRSKIPKIYDFGPFFKNRRLKFMPTRKKVFFETSFFLKNRGNGRIFLGLPSKLFYTKTY